MEDILSEIKQKDIDRVVFKNEQLHRFFPTSYTAEQMRREILEICPVNPGQIPVEYFISAN